jgi:signal peptidase I
MKKTLVLLLALSAILLTGCGDTGKVADNNLYYEMSGPSMNPLIKEGDKITAQKTDNLKRGDIVVYTNPYDKEQRHVHRIVGLPGETIKLVDGNVTVINKENPKGMQLDEPYLSNAVRDQTMPGVNKQDTFELPENGYFMLGDNRGTSLDSRECFKAVVKEAMSESIVDGGCKAEGARFYITKDDILGVVINIENKKS